MGSQTIQWEWHSSFTFLLSWLDWMSKTTSCGSCIWTVKYGCYEHDKRKSWSVQDHHPNQCQPLQTVAVKSSQSPFCWLSLLWAAQGFLAMGKYSSRTLSSIVDESLEMPQDVKQQDFLQRQRDHEQSKGRFLGSFGGELLPGMHASLIHAVLKTHSEKLRMVINQSARQFAPNTMIKWEDIKGFPLDNMRHLGAG